VANQRISGNIKFFPSQSKNYFDAAAAAAFLCSSSLAAAAAEYNNHSFSSSKQPFFLKLTIENIALAEPRGPILKALVAVGLSSHLLKMIWGVSALQKGTFFFFFIPYEKAKFIISYGGNSSYGRTTRNP